MSAVPQPTPEPRSSAATSLDRRIQMLRTAMGPLIAAALEDPDVVEELHPDPARMDDTAALAEAHERTAERAL